MQGDIKKEDLRIVKTRKALYSALMALLKRRRFSKITVHDICAESLVSRTAFYAHYTDKYNLLGQWLAEQRNQLWQIFQNDTDRQAEDRLCDFLYMHSDVIANLLEDANQEQQNLLYRFLSPDVDCAGSQRDSVLADFLAGGMFYLIVRRTRRYRKALKKEEIRTIVEYVYKMIRTLLIWESTNADQRTIH